MTFREKLAMEHPDSVDPGYVGGCEGCPHGWGYEKYAFIDCGRAEPGKNMCRKCWDRVIPGTENDEKENKTMENTKKTKAELIEEINGLKKEVEKLDRYKKYEDAANEMAALKESFENAGFTKEQAFELVIETMKGAFKTLR